MNLLESCYVKLADFYNVFNMEINLSIVGHVKRFWRFHSLIIGAFGICAFTLGCAVQEPAYYEQFLGRSVTYASDSAKLDQALCASPVYSSKEISGEEFHTAFKVSPSSLGFSDDSVTEVSLSCAEETANMGATILFQENSQAYTLVDGTFLKLEKTL